MNEMGKHFDPNLPDEGDYPTDEIDVWPLLAADAPDSAFVVDANGARHDKRGRFAKIARRPKVWTWEMVKGIRCGPDADPDGPTIYQWPDEPGVEWESESFANGAVTVCKPVGMTTTFRVTPPARKPLTAETADPARVRLWAKRSGHHVSERGRIPARVMAAYLSSQNEGG